jgi:hypothetical protein
MNLRHDGRFGLPMLAKDPAFTTREMTVSDRGGVPEIP